MPDGTETPDSLADTETLRDRDRRVDFGFGVGRRRTEMRWRRGRQQQVENPLLGGFGRLAANLGLTLVAST